MNRLQKTPALPQTESPQRSLEAPRYRPPIPRDFDQLQVPPSILRDIMLRHLRTHGVNSLRSLIRTMKISSAVAQQLFEDLRKQHLVEVKGTAGLDYSFELTEAGRRLAAERSEVCKYAGPAPVSLGEYFQAVREQAAVVKVNREDLRAALSELVVADDLLDQLGPALISQRSLFLYGPTGNGKSSYSERLTRIYADSIAVPYAIEIDGQIVTVYDPVVHHPVAMESLEIDPRWVICERPSIVAGGELISSMLELRSDESSGTYVAPLQVKANNGVFIIDDFGRQAMSPRELLNRWMVPLDRRVDYLSLSYGTKFEIPFELLVVFSTNLNPADLADEAFLRRIPNKVYVGNVTEGAFDEIFGRESSKRQLTIPKDMAKTVRDLCRQHGGDKIRACYPGDIIRIMHWVSEYEGRAIDTSKDGVERAVKLYFAQSDNIA